MRYIYFALDLIANANEMYMQRNWFYILLHFVFFIKNWQFWGHIKMLRNSVSKTLWAC